jgi:hypothetical protein
MLIGLAGGAAGTLVVPTAPNIPVVLAGWCTCQIFFNATADTSAPEPGRATPAWDQTLGVRGLGRAGGARQPLRSAQRWRLWLRQAAKIAMSVAPPKARQWLSPGALSPDAVAGSQPSTADWMATSAS